MWLLESNTRKAIENAQKTGVFPTAQQEAEYQSRYEAEANENPSRILSIAGNNAQINISGVITKNPSFFAMLFGGGNITYAEIISALVSADNDDQIESITLAVDSPGGQIDGLFDTLDAIQSISKPIKAVVSNLGASAAFAIVSQADEIVASNRATRLGGIGIVGSFLVSDDEIIITSTDAPKKRPDVTTKEGVADVRAELDALHEIFVESIAQGRGTTVEKVNADFGQGAVLLAEEALSRGMIDAIAQPKFKIVKSTQLAEANTVDIKTLKAENSELFAEVLQLGVNQERERVAAHITMGDASGDLKLTAKCIKDGSELTALISAEHSAYALRNRDISSRQAEDIDINANKGSGDDADGDAVVSLVSAHFGYQAGA